MSAGDEYNETAALPPDDLANPFAHDPAVEHALTPLWREAKWGLEWLKLRMSPVYWGHGVPHGKGEPVVLVPGFMTGDLMLLEMHRWLRRIGYNSFLSRIVWNNDCPDKTAQALMRRVRGVHKETGAKVRLIGHSLGGMLSKCIAQDASDIVERVITMGSPFRAMVQAHPAVIGVWDQLKANQSGLVGRNLHVSCGTGYCMCGFVRNMLKPKPVHIPQFAVYSRTDGVAHWRCCLEEDSSRNTEVNCTHIGMVFHPGVYQAVAKRLAQTVRQATRHDEAMETR